MQTELNVTNAELVEYLNIAYDILKVSKSSLDLNRLKTIIDILKKDEKKIYSAKKNKTVSQFEKIINILEKQKYGTELSNEEIKEFDKYVAEKNYINLAQEKNFSELCHFLDDSEDTLAVGDLSVIYYCLYQEKTKQKKRTDILNDVRTYIQQNIYFDNMDSRYQKELNENV